MRPIDITSTVKTSVTMNGYAIEDVIYKARDFAHEVLEELSIYKQENGLDPLTFGCEGSACEFLDMIGD